MRTSSPPLRDATWGLQAWCCSARRQALTWLSLPWICPVPYFPWLICILPSNFRINNIAFEKPPIIHQGKAPPGKSRLPFRLLSNLSKNYWLIIYIFHQVGLFRPVNLNFHKISGPAMAPESTVESGSKWNFKNTGCMRDGVGPVHTADT